MSHVGLEQTNPAKSISSPTGCPLHARRFFFMTTERCKNTKHVSSKQNYQPALLSSSQYTVQSEYTLKPLLA